MAKGYIHSLESFGTVDGPGIRFTVFFQGCPMRCAYCHNPDSWAVKKGTLMSAEEILEKYESVRAICKGGITATGGEPLMQTEFLTELFMKAKSRGVHTCLDTSGAVFSEDNPAFSELIKYTDLVMLDIKHIDSERHKMLTGRGNENILKFAEFLDKNGVEIWIRHVIVPKITDDEASLKRLGHFIGGLKNVTALDTLPYHTMGKEKYARLGIPYPLPDTPAASKEDALRAREVILSGIRERKNALVNN